MAVNPGNPLRPDPRFSPLLQLLAQIIRQRQGQTPVVPLGEDWKWRGRVQGAMPVPTDPRGVPVRRPVYRGPVPSRRTYGNV